MTFVTQFLNINGITTRVVSWGTVIGKGKLDRLIIFIAGNPGIPEFYYNFLEDMHKIIDMPICVLGHAGHDAITERDNIDSSSKERFNFTNKRYFMLDEQLQHKIDFIKQYTEPTTELYLYGHSIGAWMVLNMLKNDEIQSRIVKANLICPTIQKMVVSPNGVRISKLLRFQSIFCNLLWLVEKLPMWIKGSLFNWYSKSSGMLTDKFTMGAALKLVNPHIFGNMTHMAGDEFKNVTELDVDTIEKNVHRINILYSKTDGWAPNEWFEIMKSQIPALNLEEISYSHAFCVNPYDDLPQRFAHLIK